MQIRRRASGFKPAPRFSYNGEAGKWWQERAGNAAHRRAYRTIADFIRDSLPLPPRLILDYACGAGNLIALLVRRFPTSQIIGLDGSSLLLDLAEKRLSRLPDSLTRNISLIETLLPRRTVFGKSADLVIYCFPNMMPSGKEEARRGSGYCLSRQDMRIVKILARPGEGCLEEERNFDPLAVRRKLEYGRRISLHLRRLLAPNGICVRVEYATTRRHEWSPHELLQVSFEEGSLDIAVNGIHPEPRFRVLASAFFRSRVLEDVFEQTADDRDQDGGYLITVLRAIRK